MNIARITATAALCASAVVLTGCSLQRSMPTSGKAVSNYHRGEPCTVPAGLDDEILPGRLILMGEVHGTAEAPVAFGALVCRALERRLAVSVGLEFGPDQVEPIATYLASDGSKDAVAQLLCTSFWARKFQDGRSSAGMLRLVEHLRLLKQQSVNLNVFVLEAVYGEPHVASGSTRDQRMADRVRAVHESRPEALILTLTGNVHNRLEPMAAMHHRGTMPPPMGALLKDLSPRSVMLETTGGAAWVCTPECSVKKFPTLENPPIDPSRAYQKRTGTELYIAQWWLGASTASLPAVSLLAK